MRLTQALEEFIRIRQILTSEKMLTARLIAFHFFPALNPKSGGFLFIQRINPIPNVQTEIKLEHIQKALSTYILNDEFIYPSQSQFMEIFSFLQSHPNEYLVPSSYGEKLITSSINALQTNKWIIAGTTYESVMNEDPLVIFHILHKAEQFAFVFQINQLQAILPQTQEPSNQTTEALITRIKQLEQDNEALLAIGSEKEAEIQMLKNQLDLHGNSFEEQLNLTLLKNQELGRQNSQLMEELTQMKTVLFDTQEKMREIQEIYQKDQKKIQELSSQLHKTESSSKEEQKLLNDSFEQKTSEMQQKYIKEIEDLKLKLSKIDEGNIIQLTHLTEENKNLRALVEDLQIKEKIQNQNLDFLKDENRKLEDSHAKEKSEYEDKIAQLITEIEQSKKSYQDLIAKIQEKVGNLADWAKTNHDT